MKNQNTLYPIFLKLENINTLLVGGGNVGLEKLESLLNNAPNAPITIVAPFIKKEIKTLATKHSSITLVERKFENADIQSHNLVIGATDDKALHAHIKALANAQNIFTNIADTPELCDFYLSSIVQKGNLKIAISTNGKSPTLAKRVKEFLNESIPDEVDELLHHLQTIRNSMTGSFADKVKQLNSLTKSLSEKI